MYMKLALCFSGHPRTFAECYPSIKSNILDKYDCDVFISSYFVSEELSEQIKTLYNPKNVVFNDEGEIRTTCTKYINTLDAVRCLKIPVFDNRTDISYNKTYTIAESFHYSSISSNQLFYKNLCVNACCQFFGIYDVAKICSEYIRKHDIVYDYILRLRLDGSVNGEFSIDELNENEVLVNCLQHYSHSIKVQDHFFLAKPDTYFKIANLYTQLPAVFAFTNQNKCWVPTSGYQETILFLHLIMSHISIQCSEKFMILKKD